jgi:hypothetical protein
MSIFSRCFDCCLPSRAKDVGCCPPSRSKDVGLDAAVVVAPEPVTIEHRPEPEPAPVVVPVINVPEPEPPTPLEELRARAYQRKDPEDDRSAELVHVVCRVLCTNGTSIDEGRDKYEALSVARECADHVVSFPFDKWVRLASSIGTEQRAQLERALARLATLFDEHPDMSAQDAPLAVRGGKGRHDASPG